MTIFGNFHFLPSEQPLGGGAFLPQGAYAQLDFDCLSNFF